MHIHWCVAVLAIDGLINLCKLQLLHWLISYQNTFSLS
uniref:Uncharacterized protein n=1 Tax=Arundo donax TaxID=35708 RepID=A0A0A9BQN3_ARUDO